ncbi:hypothetical protein [Psychrobacter aquaticus]|nr:hypothetical protein [Psychrobacter aquaticus]
MAYLVLVWMYFKDNARQLTSSGLLLWFVVIPLLLLGSIMVLLWWQKKSDYQAVNTPDTLGEKSGEQATSKQPVTHKLFVCSRVCLPEGDCWSEVIDNNEDLTVLSDDLVGVDGLPMLIKPIAGLADAASLPYSYSYMSNADLADSDSDDNHLNNAIYHEDFNEGDGRTERIAALNSTTLRLCSLIHEQLAMSDEILSTLAEHFLQHHQQDSAKANSAIHIHPEWQQHYLVSANEESDTKPIPSAVSLPKLPIHLCIPASADSAVLIAVLKEQLTAYGIPESLVSVTLIVTNDNEQADNIETYEPLGFINEQLMLLSQSAVPELRLMLIVDSQISDEWLDSHLYSELSSDIIPTEAGVLLVFFNQAAQDVLDINNHTAVLLTEICTPNTKDTDVKNRHANKSVNKSASNQNAIDNSLQTTDHLNNKRSYLNHLTIIKNLLIDNALSLSPTLTAEPKPTKKSASAELKTNVFLSEISMTAISDINPVKQPYDVSVYMNFLEAFIAKGALVNEYNLGHYMPLNQWLKPFIGLSLFVNLAGNDRQESELLFLFTQHKQCSMLWLADLSQTSE